MLLFRILQGNRYKVNKILFLIAKTRKRNIFISNFIFEAITINYKIAFTSAINTCQTKSDK